MLFRTTAGSIAQIRRFCCIVTLNTPPGTDTKKPAVSGGLLKLIRCGRLLLRAAFELGRELLNAARRVDQAFLTGISRVRIHCHIAGHDEVFGAIDRLLAGGLHGGLGQETLARSDIEEANVVERGMDFSFHGGRKRLISPDAPCSAARLY